MSSAVSPARLRQLNAQFSGLFQDAYKSTPTYLDQLATRVSSSTTENVYGFMADLDDMREWIGPRVVERIAANGYTLRNKEFEKTIGVRARDIKDDNIGVYGPRFARLGEVAARHPWRLLVDVLLANSTCYDGKAFFATDHPVDPNDASPGSQSNLLSSKALNLDNLFAARSAMRQFKSESGTPMGVIGDTLVVHPDREQIALEITSMPSISKVFGSNTAAAAPGNIGAQLGMRVIVEPRLTSSSDWYLFSTMSAIKPFIFQEREGLSITQKTAETDDNVFDRNEYVWGAYACYNVGYGPWFQAIKCTE
jgi:phage major head subunit gpT-like protein